MLSIAMLLACTGTAPSTAPAPAPAPAPVVKNPRAVVFNGDIIACQDGDKTLGGSDCGGGRAWDAVSVAPIKDGPVVLTTLPVVGAVDMEDEPCGWLVHTKPTGDAVRGEVGRSIEVLPNTNEQYRKLIGEAVDIEEVLITGLARVDLEGDGTDEVLFSAESHDGFPMNATGLSYSFVGVRRVGAGGKAETVMLYTHKAQMSGESPMDHLSAGLLGVTDVDGDGTLEVVYTEGYYEGESWMVVALGPSGAVPVGGEGCGV